MADADALLEKSPADTRKDLIHINNSNNGVDDSVRQFYDGAGNALPLRMSKTKVQGDWGDGLIDNIVFRDVKLRWNNIGNASGTLSIGLNAGNYQKTTLTGNITSVTILNLPTSGDFYELRLYVHQDGSGGRTISGWPSGTLWPSGSAPDLSGSGANAVDIIVLGTPDAGTTWYGYRVASNMS